jgi:hypothetical protein
MLYHATLFLFLGAYNGSKVSYSLSMRMLLIATLIFLFNTALMPILAVSHEQSHPTQEGTTQITWSDNQYSGGLFQIVLDDHHPQSDSGNSSDHSGSHQCHHVSVIGIVGLMSPQVAPNHRTYISVEPLFLISSFPALIEYPPKNA